MAQVYFLQAGRIGPIKIGFTTSTISVRIKVLQTGCPWPLNLLGAFDGSFVDERGMHQKFRQFRLAGGEWFLPDKAILEFCASINPDYVPPPPTAEAIKPSDPYVSIEPIMRANLVLLATEYARETGLKLSTISTRYAGDSRFFKNLLKKKPGGFTVRIYDRAVASFRAKWPDGCVWPDIWEAAGSTEYVEIESGARSKRRLRRG